MGVELTSCFRPRLLIDSDQKEKQKHQAYHGDSLSACVPPEKTEIGHGNKKEREKRRRKRKRGEIKNKTERKREKTNILNRLVVS